MNPEALVRRLALEEFFVSQPQTAESVADSARLLWEKIDLPLTRMVGEIGTISLFVRCIDLMQAEFPWLPQNHIAYPAENTIYQSLWDCLRTQDHAEALKACISLFATFFELLAALIGERLTARIFLLSTTFDMNNDNR